MIACLTTPSCVAIDVGLVGCVLHNNVSDLLSAYNASGVTQLVLNRHCIRTTAELTRRATTVEAKKFTASSTAGIK